MKAATVVAWGDSSHAQTNAPPDLTNVLAVAGGLFHSLALESHGAVVGWGDNSSGELTPPAGLTNLLALAAGDGFSLGLQGDGTVVEWGSQTTVPAGLTNAVAVAASLDNVVALTSDGAVVPWGSPSSPVPATVTNVVAIAVGDTHYLALKGNGTVVAWGDGSLGKTDVPGGLTNVVALAAGKYHSLALTRSGTVIAWGDNTYGQSAVPLGLSNVVAIAAGSLHSLALKGDGTVVAWGDNTYDQGSVPQGLGKVVAIAAGRYHNLAVVGDGAPVITVQPVSQYDITTGKAVFTVMAAGLQPLRYQWWQDGVSIPGATNSTLVLGNLSVAASGVYSVVVSNSLGSVASRDANLPPAWRPPFVVEQPQDASVLCNDGADFRVRAGGTPPLGYQWLFEGAPVDGATNEVLTMAHVLTEQAGGYAVLVTNVYGSVSSQVASLTVIGQPPLITSPLTAAGKQGMSFDYRVTGLHEPYFFSASDLPAGLDINSTNGSIQGTPLENGVFIATIATVNLCASASTNLVLTITSSVPVITSPLTATGTEQAPFDYQIAATESPTGFGAQGLPQGLIVDPTTGVISGSPLYAGDFNATISASNVWGIGTANLRFTFTNAPITGLAIANVTTNYSSPYLLDFQFSLRDNNDPSQGNAVVVDPRLLTATGFEDDEPVSPSETAVIIQRGNAKVLKVYLVLDFTESMASLSNGDTNNNAIADTVEAEVSSAQAFVNQQPGDTQIGVYEFHREDTAPQQVSSLTTDKALLDKAIGGIWTNYVKDFPAGSRCWDALTAAIGGLGAANRDELHYVIFVSDGRDESSTNTLDDVLAAATNNNVQVYCVGFGAELDSAALQQITSATSGRYYSATNASDLATQMGQISKDVNGQYILRWATLKRSTNSFMPSFQISYQGFTATSPANPPPFVSGTNYVVDTNTMPATTNEVLVYTTNYIISPYLPSQYAGDPTVGSLRLVADADVHPSGITLRASYVPRYIRQLQLHFRANWPCSISLQSTNLGEMLYGWSLTSSNDDSGDSWALISSADPESFATGMPFASFGKLLTFSFHDVVNASNVFSVFEVDNSIYTNGGPQRFVLENTNSFVAFYPILPFGTPVPWLLEHGFSTNFEEAELSDPDGDGALTWQEYQAGTDPRDPDSKLVVRNVARTGPFDRYQITFTTELYRTYRVESSTDLLNWQTVQQDIPGTGEDATVTDNRNPTGVYQTFYRVVVH